MSDIEVAAVTAAGQASASSAAQAQAAPERKTAEDWARIRGHVDPPADKPASIPEHRAWIFRCAKALHGWAIGCELTGDEYDAGVAAAMNVRIR